MNLKNVSELIYRLYFSLTILAGHGKPCQEKFQTAQIEWMCQTCQLHHFHVHVWEPSSGVPVYTTLQKSVVLECMLATNLLLFALQLLKKRKNYNTQN